MLQVVHASYSTQVASASTTYADTGLTATITPSATSSKVLVLVTQNGVTSDSTANNAVKLQLLRGASVMTSITEIAGGAGGAAMFIQGLTIGTSWLDSPATTSATTYKTQFARAAGSGTVYVQNGSATSVSTITLLEIGA